MKTINLVTVTWSHSSNFDISKTSLFKSFKKFNPSHKFNHFHFNRNFYREEELNYQKRFGEQSDYILYKIHMLKNKLEQLDCYYVVFCDANDVVCLGPIDHVLSNFDLEKNVILGMEKNQWPVPQEKVCWIDRGFVDYSGYDSKNEFYLNSGMILAKREKFIEMLVSMEDNILSTNISNFKNDQAIYTWHYNAKHNPPIKLDYSGVFAVNTFNRSPEEFYLDEEHKLVSKLNGTKACFVHDNGWNHGSPKFVNHFELKRLYSDTYPHLKNISRDKPICPSHQEYLFKLKNEFNFHPKVIWDVGACVLHWTTIAKEVWPDSEYILFEAMEESEELFTDTNHRYCIGVFSDADNKEVTFFKNVGYPGGNSYYMENPKQSCMAEALFASPDSQFLRRTITLDTAQRNNFFPMPDLLKIDVQGCEIDVLKGASNVLRNVKHLIVELQHVEYNIGAQLCEVSIPFIESLGFRMVSKFSLSSHADADYHFEKI